MNDTANKIAVVTEDGTKISSHFGMAPLYRVFTIQDGQVTGEEERAKPHHGQHPDHSAGHDSHSHNHDDMFAPVADCQVLLVGGMGSPAYEKARAVGLEVVLAGGEIHATLQAYLDGQLETDLRRVHRH